MGIARVRQTATDHRGITGFVVGIVATASIAGGGIALAAIPSTSTGQYTACVHKKSGDVRIIDFQAGKRCITGERTVNWSKGWKHRGDWSASASYTVGDVVVQAGSSYVATTGSRGKAPSATPQSWKVVARAGTPGPQGPAGAQGPAGPQGPAGQPGASGPLDLVYVRTGPLGADPGVTEVYLFCPEGLSPTGGGLASSGSDTALSMHGSFPFDDSMLSPNADLDTIPDNGWAVEVNNEATTTAGFAAYAVCGSATTVDQEYVTVSPAGITTQKATGGVRIVARPDSSTKSGN